MAVTLRKYLNNQLKAKGLTLTQAKKNAGKYKSIAAAKKAGSLYYTDKNGNVMAAVYAEDLKKPIKPIKPRARPGSTKSVLNPEEIAEVKRANKELSTREIKRIVEGALTKAEAKKRVKDYYSSLKKNKKPKKVLLFIANPGAAAAGQYKGGMTRRKKVKR
tara:strand:+ start:133 stop:615 length:483 start_codon:yes stop_codon:yes gene_type:complete